MQQDKIEISSLQDEDSKLLNDLELPNGLTKQASPCQSLLDLPLEIQAQIFDSYLGAKDQFQIRLVHSHLQVLLDDYIGFDVAINEDDPRDKSEFLSELAIRKATIHSMSKFKDPVNGKLIPLVFGDIFSYPQYLQCIFVMGGISQDFLSEMVRKCKVVDVFELSSRSFITSNPMENSDVEVSSEILPEVNILSLEQHKEPYFPRCRILKLLLKDISSSSLSSRDVHTQAVLKIMRATQSPLLERVVMQCWTTEQFPVSRISLISAECLERNPSITSYFVGILYDPLAENDYENLIHQDEDKDLREIVKTKFRKASQQMTVRKLGISTSSADMALWKEFIKYQNNLVHISLTVDVEDRIFSNEMFISCQKTLTQFVLRGKFLTTFDFHWLEDCLKLKEICLHNINEEELEGPTVHAVNVSSIPEGVESLVLFQTTARTDEMRAALRKLTRLDTLVLFKTGNTAGETGLDPECLKMIFKCRTLQSVLLVRFVASSPESAAELVKMLQDINEFWNTNNIVNEVVGVSSEMLELEDDVPPLIAIEDQGSASNEPEVLGRESKLISNIFDADATPAFLMNPMLDGCEDLKEQQAQRKWSLNSLNNNNSAEAITDSKPQSYNFIFDPEDFEDERKRTEESVATPSTLNTLDECCAIGLTNTEPVPVHKMEPNLLTESDSKSDKVEEGGSFYPKVSENPGGQSNKKDMSLEEDDPSKYISTTAEMIDNPLNQINEEDWGDIEDEEDDYDSDEDDESLWEFDIQDHDAGFVVGMENDNNVGLDVIGQAENAHNFQLVLNLEDEGDLQDMLGLFEPAGENNNIAFGFILDAVVDIMNIETKRSRWVAVEDDEGHLTYTLKITID